MHKINLIDAAVPGIFVSEKKLSSHLKNIIDMNAIHITKEEFLSRIWNYEKDPQNWNYLGDKPAIVDFYATWCGPCQRLSPILDELAQEYAGRVDFFKVDTGQEEELSEAFRIRSVPSLLFCRKDGKPGMSQGVLDKPQLRQLIKEHLLQRSEGQD